MNTEVIHNTLTQSPAGKMTFPEVVRALLAEGVESYRTDLVCREKTSYMPNGEIHIESFSFTPAPIAASFSQTQVIAALRAVQAQQIKYPEFLNRIAAAETTTYSVFLNGKKAIYFGRNGDLHIENFPAAKP